MALWQKSLTRMPALLTGMPSIPLPRSLLRCLPRLSKVQGLETPEEAAADAGIDAGTRREAIDIESTNTSCSPTCVRHDTCNEELGRCDCPFAFTGDDCSKVSNFRWILVAPNSRDRSEGFVQSCDRSEA
eukprot:1193617-Prorocentrum_minimum.AAC.7